MAPTENNGTQRQPLHKELAISGDYRGGSKRKQVKKMRRILQGDLPELPDYLICMDYRKIIVNLDIAFKLLSLAQSFP